MILLRIMGKMPVTFEPDDNQRWWIAGDPLLSNDEHSAMSEDSRNLQRTSTTESGASWPFTKKKDMGNESLSLSFSTSRTFAGLEEAWEWRNNFSSLDESLWPHPIEGDCVMRFLRADGTFSEARLYDCLLSKPVMKSNGKEINLSYTLSGGRIEPYAEGETVKLVATALPGLPAMLKIYGTHAGGEFTDATTDFISWIASNDVPQVGWVFTLDGFSESTVLAATKVFEVINVGGSAGEGRLPVDFELTDNLGVLQAQINGGGFTATVVTPDSGRPYVLVAWAGAVGSEGIEGTQLTLYLKESSGGSTKYSAAIYGNMPIPALLVDDNGLILCADELV